MNFGLQAILYDRETNKYMNHTMTIKRHFPYPVATVWKALTDEQLPPVLSLISKEDTVKK
jgi:hypothetical protein